MPMELNMLSRQESSGESSDRDYEKLNILHLF